MHTKDQPIITSLRDAWLNAKAQRDGWIAEKTKIEAVIANFDTFIKSVEDLFPSFLKEPEPPAPQQFAPAQQRPLLPRRINEYLRIVLKEAKQPMDWPKIMEQVTGRLKGIALRWNDISPHINELQRLGLVIRTTGPTENYHWHLYGGSMLDNIRAACFEIVDSMQLVTEVDVLDWWERQNLRKLEDDERSSMDLWLLRLCSLQFLLPTGVITAPGTDEIVLYDMVETHDESWAPEYDVMSDAGSAAVKVAIAHLDKTSQIICPPTVAHWIMQHRLHRAFDDVNAAKHLSILEDKAWIEYTGQGSPEEFNQEYRLINTTLFKYT